MFEDEDQEILKKLRKKKQSFEELVNKKRVNRFELDSAVFDEF
ncbi:MAG: hypothetical protein ABIG95_04170 [Candidatus Woesearchaeota archaeon]